MRRLPVRSQGAREGPRKPRIKEEQKNNWEDPSVAWWGPDLWKGSKGESNKNYMGACVNRVLQK